MPHDEFQYVKLVSNLRKIMPEGVDNWGMRCVP